MKPPLKMTLGLLLNAFCWSISSPSPVSPEDKDVCIKEPELLKVKKVLDQHKKDYAAIQSQVCLLAANQAPANISTTNQDADKQSSTNQDEDNGVLSAWMDLYQLHLNVQRLFDNYTTWLETSNKQRTLVLPSDTQVDDTELKTVVFSLWLQLQESNKRIDKLEKYRKTAMLNDESTMKEKSSNLNLQDKQDVLNHKDPDNKQGNSIKDKLNSEVSKDSTIFPNDLHYLQSQIKDLNVTVKTLVKKTEQLQEEVTSMRNINGADSLFGELTKEENAITNETCNGSRRHLVGNSCYFIPRIYESEHMYTWWDARYFCKQLDVLGPEGDLVVIDSKQKMDDIKDMLANHFGGVEAFWIGASDIEQEGHWTWVKNDAPLSSGASYWAQQPAHNTLTNCAAMEEGYQWIPEPCYYERVPLCELRL